jgi:hypothetical protein
MSTCQGALLIQDVKGANKINGLSSVATMVQAEKLMMDGMGIVFNCFLTISEQGYSIFSESG